MMLQGDALMPECVPLLYLITNNSNENGYDKS